MKTIPTPEVVAAKFPLGEVLITDQADARIDPASIAEGLARHASGDWGDSCPEGALENEIGLAEGDSLLSFYRSAVGVVFWVMTDLKLGTTTVLLPEES